METTLKVIKLVKPLLDKLLGWKAVIRQSYASFWTNMELAGKDVPEMQN
jgi:hypothetical protein